MALFTTSAFVLRSQDYQEFDKLVTFFTERFGKIRAIAKGARRLTSRMVALLEPLAVIQVNYWKQGESLARVNTIDVVETFGELRRSLEGVYRGLYVLELLDKFTIDNVENQQVFHMFTAILRLLNAGVKCPESLHRYAELQYLCLSGFAPGIDQCAHCKKNVFQNIAYYQTNDGTLLCESCAGTHVKKLPLTLGALQFLRTAQTAQPEIIARTVLTANQNNLVFTYLKTLYGIHFNRELTLFTPTE